MKPPLKKYLAGLMQLCNLVPDGGAMLIQRADVKAVLKMLAHALEIMRDGRPGALSQHIESDLAAIEALIPDADKATEATQIEGNVGA